MREQALYKALLYGKEYLEKQGYTVFMIAVQGSQNYNMDVYTEAYMSDVDLKAFVLPSFEDVYFNKMVSKVYEVNSVEHNLAHVEVKDIRLMPELMGKMNTSYLELLATDFYWTANKPVALKLRALLPQLVTERKPLLLKAMYGMALEKEKAFSHPYPSLVDKIEKYGYDPKQLHHIVRLCLLMGDVLEGFGYAESLKHDPMSHTGYILMRTKTHPMEYDAAVVAKNALIKQMKEDLNTYMATNPAITGEALNEMKNLVAEAVKTHLAHELNPVKLGYEVQGYKCVPSQLPAEGRKQLAASHPEYTDEYLVDVHKVSYWELYNAWKK